MKLFVKYMVSLRCKMKVQEELRNMGLPHVVVDLGVVELLEDLTKEQRAYLDLKLRESGLELLDDSRSIMVERIKNVITEMIHNSDELPEVNFSDFLSEELGYDYTYLANVFSEVRGTTIQHYIIINKIERAKELLFYNELSLTEIAYRLHYSSVAHLSAQFKKVTGLTPTFYKNLKKKRRLNLEDV